MNADDDRAIPLLVGLVVFCLVVGGLFWSLAGAPPASPPDVAAARVVAFYREVERMDVAFSLHVWRNAERRTTTNRGRLAVEPHRHRMELATDTGAFAVEAGELTLGDTGAGPTDSVLLAAMFDVLGADLGTFGRALLERGPTDPPDTDVLELTPSFDAPYERVILYVSNAPHTEGVVLRLIAEVPSGDYVRFDLSDFHFTEPPD